MAGLEGGSTTVGRPTGFTTGDDRLDVSACDSLSIRALSMLKLTLRLCLVSGESPLIAGVTEGAR